MDIIILETRGEIESSCPYYSRHSGVLINRELLLDCGETEFFDLNPSWILITHYHPDHAVFLKQTVKTEIPIYGPESYINCVRVQEIHTRLQIQSYTVFPIPTLHSKKVRSQGYLIQTKVHSLLYTGDLCAITTSVLERYAPLDTVSTEASFLRKGGLVKKDKDTDRRYGHAGVPFISVFFIHTNSASHAFLVPGFIETSTRHAASSPN